MNQQPQEKPQGAWVRLWFVPQTEMTTMPPFVEGYLTEETPGAYVLSKVIVEQENEETYQIDRVELVEHNFINRTYVWRCQLLGRSPVGASEDIYNGEGGLG